MASLLEQVEQLEAKVAEQENSIDILVRRIVHLENLVGVENTDPNPEQYEHTNKVRKSDYEWGDSDYGWLIIENGEEDDRQEDRRYFRGIRKGKASWTSSPHNAKRYFQEGDAKKEIKAIAELRGKSSTVPYLGEEGY